MVDAMGSWMVVQMVDVKVDSLVGLKELTLVEQMVVESVASSVVLKVVLLVV